MTTPKSPEARAVQTIKMMVSQTPGYPQYQVATASAPSYDQKALDPRDQALVDYWMVKHHRDPGPPSVDTLIGEFIGRFIGADAKSQRTITVSKVWPSWMIDTLAVAWKQFRTQPGFNDAKLLKDHPGGELFLTSERPLYGSIEVDFKTERTELLAEQSAYLEPTSTSGMIVKINLTGGFSSPSLEIMTHERQREAAQRFIDSFQKCAEAANIYRGKHLNVVSGRIKFTKVEPATFDQIIMSKKVIDLVKANTVDLMDRRDQLKRYNIGTTHATILAGMPGTGKTLLGRAVVSALGSSVTTWIVTAKAFYGAYDVTNFYEMVRAFGPAFVMFEDLDMIGRERSPNSSNEILGELLNQMSGTLSNEDGILTLASTNDLSALDAALSDRPERIGTKIFIPMPDRKARKSMFNMFALKFNSKIEQTATAWDSILGASEGLTGDYVRAVVRLAVCSAVNELDKTKVCASSLLLYERNLQMALVEILRSRNTGSKKGESVCNDNYKLRLEEAKL